MPGLRDCQRARRKFCGECGARPRGRAVDADRALIRAGIAALGGDTAGALAGFRSALASFRELGPLRDEAQLGLEAAMLVGVQEPEVAGWADAARAIFERLGARPMPDSLDAAIAGASAG